MEVVCRGESLGEVEVCYKDVLIMRVDVLNATTLVGVGSRIGYAWPEALLFRAGEFVCLYVIHC